MVRLGADAAASRQRSKEAPSNDGVIGDIADHEEFMQARIRVTTLAAVCSVFTASACKPGEESHPPAETATSAGILAVSRGEWHTALDSVRATFGRDRDATARALRSTAIVVRQEAREANEGARYALDRSADELDSLAASTSSDARRSRQSLDGAFARLEHAEALNRIANATDAWARQERARAGDELQSGAEHFERAAKNAKIELDAQATRAATDARSVGRRLSDAAAVTTNEFLRTVTALDRQVRKLATRIARKT